MNWTVSCFNLRVFLLCLWAVVSTLAGSGSAGFADGAGAQAAFKSPHGVAVDAAGNVFVADASNHLIRKVTPAGGTRDLLHSFPICDSVF